MLQEINWGTCQYVTKEAHGFSCLGFDVLERRGNRLAKELGVRINFTEIPNGEYKYNKFSQLEDLAHKRFTETGCCCECELHPKFIPFMGERVETIFENGEKERFRVGRSTGWIPCLLRLHNSRSRSGGTIDRDEKVLSVRQVY